MVLKSLKSGFGQTLRNKRIILLFYLCNFLLALILILPLSAMFDSFIGKSMVRESLGAGMDWDFMFEFIDHYARMLPNLNFQFLLMPVLFALSIIFLSGGTISLFADDSGYQAHQFWGDCGRYFGRFFRLALWSLPVFGILIALRYLAVGVERLIFGADPYENIAFWFGKAKVLLSFVGLMIYGVIFDYSRIYIIRTGERKTRKALWRSIKFVFKHFVKTFGFALILYIIGGIFLFLYYHISNLFTSPNLAMVILLILFQQIYILWRVVLRLTFYSGQIDLYGNITYSYIDQTSIYKSDESL